MQAGEIGRALLAEGCQLLSVEQLGRCYRARDIDRLAKSRAPLLREMDPYQLVIPVLDPNRPGLTTRKQQLLLPHELFSCLFRLQPRFFAQTFATDRLGDFWRRIDPARVASINPTAATDVNVLSRMVPIQVYGDDVSVSKTMSCLVMLFKSSVSFRLPALEALLPVSSTLLRHCDRRSIESLLAVIRWSIECLAAGHHPDVDHQGQAWNDRTDPSGNRRAAAGTQLAGGFFGVFFEAVGDWEWICKTFGFNEWRVSYNCANICFRCPASIHPGRFFFKTLDYDSEIFSADVARTVDELRAAVVPFPQLARFAGFSLDASVLWDWLHVSPLGFQHKSAGNCLVELALEGKFGVFGGDWRVRMGIAFKRAYADFCRWCSGRRLRHSQQQFTCATLSVASGATDLPHLKGKAHNLMCVSKWLADLVADDSASPRRRARSRVMWAIACLDTLFATSGQWLDDAEIEQLQVARRVFFPSWRFLAEHGDDGTWQRLPKHHAAMHMLDDAVRTRRNPAGFWCFAGEHLMGLCKKSLAGQFQIGVDDRILRAALYRLGVVARDFSLAAP